jgi:hypothetical protein
MNSNELPVTLFLSFYPSDIEDIQDILLEGRSCGILEHIVNQYQLSKGQDDETSTRSEASR